MTERTVRAKFLIDVTGAVANVGKLANKVNDAAKAGTDFAAKNKSSFDGVAQSAAAFGATAAVGVGLAIKRFADFDKAMSDVQAATHETAGNMDLLRTAALQAGKDTAFSASEAAAGIENLAKAGISTADILNGGLKGALDLAAAGQISVADASEVAATAITQFGLSGKDVPHIADLLAAAAGKAQGEVGDMAAALKQSGLVADQFGLSIEETTGGLAAFASAGLIGSDAGTSFKTMLIALANPSKESSELMDQLGVHAYDAQGAFIGLAPLAEQLKQRLSGLTAEQRNQALAQIFGNDALRAANVLYEQGGAGITEWTTKVNDAGFASETARIKTDNLTGDLERLGGAFDTALIQGGSGANSVLRALVQTADGAVSAFGDLPPAVSGVATALGGVAAVGGLGAAALLKGATAAGELRQQWQGLGRTGRTLTLSMGAVGIALTAAAAIYGVFAKRNEEAAGKVEDLRSTLDEQTGAITGNTRAFVANELAQSGLAQSAKDMGLNLETVTDAALGNDTALQSVLASLDGVIAANDRYQRGSKNSGAEKQADDARALREELIKTSGSLSDAQKQQLLAAEAVGKNAGATKNYKTTAEEATAAIERQTQSTKQLIETMLTMPGLVLSLRDAQRAWEESLDKANEALKENGRTLDISTPKGRANQEALDGMANSANNVTKSMLENGASNLSVVRTYEANRAGLVKTAMQFGLNRKQAENYAKSVLAIPPKSETTLKADVRDLDTKLASARKQLKDPDLTKTRRAKLEATIAQLLAQKKKAQDAIDSMHGKNVNITASVTVNAKINAASVRAKVDAQLARAGLVAYADGGQLRGYSPHPKADNIVFAGTAGEWVQPNDAVDYYTPAVMEAMQKKLIPREIFGFADGGQLGTQALAGGSRFIGQSTVIGSAAQLSAPVYLTTHVTNNIQIGDETVRVVQREIRTSNAGIKRDLRQRTG